MSRILAIDPGDKISGIVMIEDGKILWAENHDNYTVGMIVGALDHERVKVDTLAIEWITSYGMPVGKTTFETCLFIGQLTQKAKYKVNNIRLIPRRVVKHFHTGKAVAKDGNVTAALKEKYGEKGTKANPGYFYGVSKHAWQAFAVGAYVLEGGTHKDELSF